MMQLALVVMSLTIFGFVIGRAVVHRSRRSTRAKRHAARTDRSLGGAVLELEGIAWEGCLLDGIAFPVGVTSEKPRGFSHMPAGHYRVELVTEGGRRSLELDLRPGEAVVVLEEAGELRARPSALAPGPFNASYIHFPTWARGPLKMLCGGTSLSRGRQEA